MLSQKRNFIAFIIAAVLVITLACQSVVNIVYPNSSSPNITPQAVSSYDGDWEGITSQDQKITFTVVRGAIIIIKIRAILVGPGCVSAPSPVTKALVEPTALAAGNFTPTFPIINSSFTITEYFNGRKTSTLIGTFSSSNFSSGTFEYIAFETFCEGTIKVNWTAEKTVQ